MSRDYKKLYKAALDDVVSVNDEAHGYLERLNQAQAEIKALEEHIFGLTYQISLIRSALSVEWRKKEPS